MPRPHGYDWGGRSNGVAPPLHSGPRFDHADLVNGEGKKKQTKIGCSSSLLHVAVTHVDLTAPRGACACVPACAPPSRHPGAVNWV